MHQGLEVIDPRRSSAARNFLIFVVELVPLVVGEDVATPASSTTSNTAPPGSERAAESDKVEDPCWWRSRYDGEKPTTRRSSQEQDAFRVSCY